MEDADRYLLSSVNSKTPRVVCLLHRGGQEGDESVNRWSRMGVEHFQPTRMCKRFASLTKSFGERSALDSTLENADFIYFSGGSPDGICFKLRVLRVEILCKRRGAGAIICVAVRRGAMILSKRGAGFLPLSNCGWIWRSSLRNLSSAFRRDAAGVRR